MISLDNQIDNYEAMLMQNPDDLVSLMLYGEANFRRGKKLAAISAYQKIIKIESNNIKARNALGRIYLSQKMIDEAYNELLTVLDMESNNIEARFLLTQTQKLFSPLSEEISLRLNNLSTFSPALKEIRYFLNQLLNEKEEAEKQITEYQTNLNNNPDDVFLEFDIQMCLKRKSDIEEIISFVKQTEEQELEKIRQEEEERLRKEEEERLRQEEEERLRKEEEERLRKEEEERLRKEEEERLRKEEEERLRQEEEERLRKEEERLRKEEEKRLNEDTLQKLGELFVPNLQDFASNKMVAEVLLVNIDGLIVKRSTPHSFESDKFGYLVSDGVSMVKTWKSMEFWVSEYLQGLIFIKMIAKDLLLIVNGGSGSNFGALKIVIDRNEKELIKTLRESEFSYLLADN